MIRFSMAALLAVGMIAAAAGPGSAGGWIDGRSAGFGAFGDKCLTCFPGIHQHGPLYNYTPMQGQYTWMQLHWSQLHNYTPAQQLYFPGYGCNDGNCGGNAGRDALKHSGLFSGLFGCGLHTSAGCGGSKWFGWFNSGCGGTWSNIFHRGDCESCAGGCTGCGSTTAPFPTPAPIRQTSYDSLYPDYLTTSWR